MFQWLFFSFALALATWAFLTGKAWKAAGETPGGQRLRIALLVLARIAVAIAVLSIGFVLEPALRLASTGGSADEALAGIGGAFFSGMVPASVVTVVADVARNRKDRISNSAVAAVFILVLLDVGFSFLAPRPGDEFLFSMFSDLFGGAVAGIIVGLTADILKARERSGARATK